ncbi:hypothetical protein [Vallitalea okinawensis]|uniref:hypothetical protein n=1 Tax=Vallitalea okinawensis TaxID=2078660 RepID=UPI000CFC4BE5|nr:hypothetical protein [Vallitalea okinawensis]
MKKSLKYWILGFLLVLSLISYLVYNIEIVDLDYLDTYQVISEVDEDKVSLNGEYNRVHLLKNARDYSDYIDSYFYIYYDIDTVDYLDFENEDLLIVNPEGETGIEGDSFSVSKIIKFRSYAFLYMSDSGTYKIESEDGRYQCSFYAPIPKGILDEDTEFILLKWKNDDSNITTHYDRSE